MIEVDRLKWQLRTLVSIHERLTRLELSERTVEEIARLRQVMLAISEWQQNMFVELVSSAGIEAIGVFREFRDQNPGNWPEQADAHVRVAEKSGVGKVADGSRGTKRNEVVRDSERRSMADKSAIHAAAWQAGTRF